MVFEGLLRPTWAWAGLGPGRPGPGRAWAHGRGLWPRPYRPIHREILFSENNSERKTGAATVVGLGIKKISFVSILKRSAKI